MSTRDFKTMGRMIRSIKDSNLANLIRTMIANIETVYDHGNLSASSLAEDTHPNYVPTNITRELSAGYTREVYDYGAINSGTLVPDVTKPDLQLLKVTGAFTLNKPDYAGHCEMYVEVTGTGPYAVTLGTDVQSIDGAISLVVGTDYVLNVRRYASDKVVVQAIELP